MLSLDTRSITLSHKAKKWKGLMIMIISASFDKDAVTCRDKAIKARYDSVISKIKQKIDEESSRLKDVAIIDMSEIPYCIEYLDRVLQTVVETGFMYEIRHTVPGYSGGDYYKIKEPVIREIIEYIETSFYEVILDYKSSITFDDVSMMRTFKKYKTFVVSELAARGLSEDSIVINETTGAVKSVTLTVKPLHELLIFWNSSPPVGDDPEQYNYAQKIYAKWEDDINQKFESMYTEMETKIEEAVTAGKTEIIYTISNEGLYKNEGYLNMIISTIRYHGFTVTQESANKLLIQW